ncbi:MAG: D-alanyl-D-alanine carboxypeptidase [Candidatus Harrisonbacteria bacterium]|nr:D-alanyl-D-alanine carboxypeptidase [Candidatus Harrisonbacteria bacterium]
MRETNLNNALLVGLVVLAVLLGGIKSGTPDNEVINAKSEATSVVASVRETTQESFAPAPFVSATAYLVKDIFAVEPIWEKNTSRKWPIASITKLMTAIITLEVFDLQERVVMSREAIATEGVAGFFETGKSYTVEELLNALLKYSSNDAGEALAERYGKEKFLWAMNAKAQAIGMHDTNLNDPTGLSVLNQSTIVDLEKLVLYIFNRYPEIFLITRQTGSNIHPFAGHVNFLGGKTGFIDEANGNLISLFNRGGRPILIIVLGSDDRAKDTQILYDSVTSG